MKLVQQWWRQPERYQWLVGYLETHGVQTWARIMMCLALVAGGLTPVLVLASAAGPQGTVGRVLSVAAGAVGMSTVLLWLRPGWPSRKQSVLFALVVTVCIATGLLSGTTPAVALAGCALFILIGGYVAIFHSAPLLFFCMAAAAGTAGVLALQLAQQDPVIAVVELMIVVTTNVAVVISSNWMIHMLSVDMVNSDLDPLTGLLNRRACWTRATELVGLHRRSQDSHLLIVIIDLDRFKKLNDTRGHAVGDRALVAVARALRGHSRQTAVVARIGGEEFLFVDLIPSMARDAGIGELLRGGILSSWQ
ncbi:MAG: GGDEF domain-containing protein, partial [Mycobacterium sp.]